MRTVLAIELLCAAQGIDLRAPLAPAARLQKVHRRLRQTVPAMMGDRPIYPDIEAVRQIMCGGRFLEDA